MELVYLLEEIRSYFSNRPIHITSACRCKAHNSAVGGARYSQHLYGNACDLYVDGVEPIFVAAYLRTTYPYSLGIGEYENFIHVDVRKEKARWEG